MSQYSGLNFYGQAENHRQEISNYFEFQDQFFLKPSSQKNIPFQGPNSMLHAHRQSKRQNAESTKDENTGLAQARKARVIQISQAKRTAFIETTKGAKNQTVQLNTNFKTILLNHLKELNYLRELNEKQVQILTDYKKKIPSFQAILNIFFQNQGSLALRNKVLKFLGNPRVVRKILRSKANQINKMTMLKFLQILRINLQGKGKIIKWKSYKKVGLA